MTAATTLIKTDVAGLNVHVEGETTRGDIASQYLNYLAPITNLLDQEKSKTVSTDLNPTALDSQGYTTQVQNSIIGLINLANNGINLPADPTQPNGIHVTYYLTQEMASNLDSLFNSLKVSGINIDASTSPPTVSVNADSLRRWLDLSDISPIVSQLMGNCIDSANTATRTFQALIELDYVSTSNQTLSQKLSNLEDALNTTEGVLKTLSDVQDLHNQVTPVTPTGYVPPSDSPSGKNTADKNNAYSAAFNSATNTAFAPIPLAALGSGDPAQTQVLYSRFDSIVQSLNSEISTLQTQFHTIDPNTGMQAIDPTTGKPVVDPEILSRLKTVRDDMVQSSTVDTSAIDAQIQTLQQKLKIANNSFGQINPATVGLQRQLTNLQNQKAQMEANAKSAWFTDGWTSQGAIDTSGQLQQHISFAISAAENLNDQQKVNVQNFMFVFQQFYTSASSLLTKISQIIEQEGQAVSR